MIFRCTYVALICIYIAACTNNLSLIEDASARYKLDKNYTSLKVIFKSLHKGMDRQSVERLLGEPDYSPIDGQYYYSSDGTSSMEAQGREVDLGLVVDYRDPEGAVTESLYECWLGPIGE